MKCAFLSFTALCLVAICVSAETPVKPIPVPPELPVETIFTTPSLTSLEFSPNGKYVLCVVPYKGQPNLAVIDLEKGTKNLLSSFNDKQVTSPFWASNDRILFFVDDGGRERWHLYSVNRDGSDPSDLGPNRYEFLQRLKDDPRHILVNNGRVVKVNVATGRFHSQVASAPGEIGGDYLLDHNDQVRMVTVSNADAGGNTIYYREANGQEWKKIASFKFDEPSWSPLAFDGDNRTLYVWSDINRKTGAIYRFDTANQTLGDLVFGDDTYDAGSAIYDPSKKKIVGFSIEADRLRYHWIDDEMKTIQEKLEKALPNTVHAPIQFSEDGSRVIYHSYSDRDPGVYYLYDRKRQKFTEIAVIRPGIDPEQMAKTQPVAYKARDGMLLHGYLTLPVGREAKNLPLVIHPHGGPYGVRDDWGYDSEVQFYANRGYAVFQINYRGSGGYGFWYEAAGFRKWGLEMQDDLTDGVKWAIDQGIADPARVVISGASYGGYATMAGLVYTPDLYCAGINYVGVVDIETLIPKAVSPGKMQWIYTRLADLRKAEDRKRIYDTSPVHFADRIRVPLLMAYGKNDPRVEISHAYDIERALKRADRPYELIIVKEEGHGFHTEKNRIAFYKRIDAFLKKYVPPASAVKVVITEAIPEAAKK